MTLHSLPLFVRLQGRAVILVGEGEAAAAKRRLLERAGAVVVGEAEPAALAIVVDDDDAVARLKARGVLVNAVDRAELCDFTLPAIVDRDPVIIAIGTGGVSAGLAAALRQRLEGLLPATLGRLAVFLRDWRPELRKAFPDGSDRRRAIARALAPGAVLDLGNPYFEDPFWVSDLQRDEAPWTLHYVRLRSPDPDDLTVGEARLLATADLVLHRASVPDAILNRCRADAPRIAAPRQSVGAKPPGLGVIVDIDWA